MNDENGQSVHHKRVFAAFNGKVHDRIPICEQAFASSVAGKFLGYEAYTGSTDIHYFEACAWLEGESCHQEFVEKVYADTLALHRYFDFDILFMPWRKAARPSRRVSETRILYGDPDGDDWELCEYDPESRTYGRIAWARKENTYEDVCEIIRNMLKDAGKMEYAPRIHPFIKRALDEYGHEFVVSGDACMMIPMEPGWLEATVLDPALIEAYLDLQVEGLLKYLEAQHKGGIRLVNGGGDFAFNSGPMYSPAFFIKSVYPRWKRLFDFCREKGMFYVFRSDGNLWSVADYLFGDGNAHAYYECDYDAGMRFADLRARYPEVVLFGNVSCDLLVTGTPQEVSEVVVECIEGAFPRVVIGSSNSVLHGSPIENVIAMYETVKNYIIP